MALLRTVEIQFSVFFALPVIHRNAIGISIIPQHRKHASLLFLQDPDALFFTDLLFEPAHRPEYCRFFRFHFSSLLSLKYKKILSQIRTFLQPVIIQLILKYITNDRNPEHCASHFVPL